MATLQTENDSTRIFVSGLPPSLTSDQLASHFRKDYGVTDAHVFASRRIGFVGFNDTTTAKDAVKRFNRSYIRMSKISVDLARPVEVRHTTSGQAVPKTRREAVPTPTNLPRTAQSLTTKTVNSSATTYGVSETDSKKRKRTSEDDGEEVRAASETTNQAFLATQELSGGRNVSEIDKNQSEPEAKEQSARSDDDWLRGRTSRLLDLVDPEEAEKIVHTSTTQAQVSDAEQEEQRDTTVGDEEETNDVVQQSQRVPNARLFLRNLAFDITDEDIRIKFSEFGKIQEAHVVKDIRKSTSKGLAFVQYSEPEHAENALRTMDGTAFHGRLLHVLPASDKREQGLNDFDISKLPLKKQKEIRRKQEANSASFSWNSLYMNPDAVMSSIAHRLGVAKSDILDATSADAAIKQAHAETQVIAETKAYLKAHGVNIDALKNEKRDERTILLKNFPYGTTEAELRELIDPFGQTSKFMLPPAGTMAIVQFVEHFAASQALKSLAYKNIKGSVLYLEKAPQGLLDGAMTPNSAAGDKADDGPKTVGLTETTSSGPTATVFVRNLNFSTTGARLTEAFSPLAGFLSARVKTRTDPKRPGEILSMGFGFVEFKTRSQAEAAAAAMNGRKIDNHDLTVQLSNKANDLGEERRKDDIARKTDANSTKILIKNLPFQASRRDVRALFAPYGQLKTVRVPKKFDNTSRGFGFAEFITAKEAENAMEALSNTHLLGRRLVLSFASEDTVDPEAEISALEKKMEAQSNRFNISKLSGTGRKKFNVVGDEDI